VHELVIQGGQVALDHGRAECDIGIDAHCPVDQIVWRPCTQGRRFLIPLYLEA
jgi:hypothetical protein